MGILRAFKEYCHSCTLTYRINQSRYLYPQENIIMPLTNKGPVEHACNFQGGSLQPLMHQSQSKPRDSFSSIKKSLQLSDIKPIFYLDEDQFWRDGCGPNMYRNDTPTVTFRGYWVGINTSKLSIQYRSAIIIYIYFN